MSEGDSSNGALLFYVFDGLITLRALYGFVKSYFMARLESQKRNDLGLASGSENGEAEGPGKALVRVYMDGCFDMMHFGHANALRQAKMLGDVLVVGINSDEEIRMHKGPPVMNDKERFIAVEAVKWVDEIIENAPYDLTADFLKVLFEDYNIDYIIHGDDPCIGKDGQDVYAAAKRAGRFRSIKRTEGVSSTDIVGRMLLCTRTHHLDGFTGSDGDNEAGAQREQRNGSKAGRVSTFLPTTRRLIQFASGGRAPKPTDRVIYVDGGFDMFHCGHVLTLKAAQKIGDFVLVGIHDDATINAKKGKNFPIMNLHERTLSVLSCKYVDEVIIGAPWAVTEDMIKTMNISIVLRGKNWERGNLENSKNAIDPYSYPRSIGIFHEIESDSNLSVEEIIERIVRNRTQYEQRNKKKVAQEQGYFSNKTYVEEL
mmetsp:Transcript_9815/g.19995  ORF Transcript_9815/g.19995 Transcript_9815/m.19995 type:complete len:428 (-) Transcript_9815:353-1636(-)